MTNKPQWDWSKYNGNLKWLPHNTVFLARAGSWSYGTNTPESDEDWRGIAIPPKEYVFGTLHKFEQAEIKDPDCVIFNLQKFIHLASQANPNVIELAFSDPSDVIIDRPWKCDLYKVRDLFLTKRVRHTYSGYAMGQLKRLKLHREYHTNPPKKQPKRADFELPENTLVPGDQLKSIETEIRKKLDSWSIKYLDDQPVSVRIALTNKFTEHLADIGIASQADLWLPAARSLGASDNLIEAMKKERGYASAKRDYDNYFKWKLDRNPARSALEEKFGYDGKFAMHLVRLMRQCREILTTGKVIVKRPDAEELLLIRNGAWSYDYLIDWVTTQDKELQQVAADSKLPHAPDVEKIDKWLVDTLERWYGN